MKIDRRLVEALDDLLVRAFAEDGEDVTTLAVFGPKSRVEADMVCRDAAVVAGVAFLPRVFAFLHLFEPHAPYEAPEPFRSRFADPYDAEVAASDEIVGAFF